jgi:hypothetical protein
MARNAHIIICKLVICKTAEGVSVVSDSEVLVRFVTPDGEGTARNISECHKIL